MKEKCSERKIEANRRNAQQSTGPKTSAGKLRARLNAIRHGILSNEVVVRDGDGVESAADFAELLESLHAQLQPRDAIECVLVDRVAACCWRLRRAQRFEVGAVREGLDSCKTPLDGPGPNMKKHEAAVRHYQRMIDIERYFDRRSAQSRQNPGVHGTTASPGGVKDPSDHRTDAASDPAPNDSASTEPKDRFAEAEAALRQYAGMTEYAEQQDALADSRRPLLAALPNDEQLNRLIRYETMLDRQLHRALAELRRRRQWTDASPSDKPKETDPKEP